MTVVVAKQPPVKPFTSFTFTVYVPAARPIRSCETAPLLQEYVYGAVPPAGVKSIAPVVAALHKTLVCVKAKDNAAAGCVIVTVVVAAQPPDPPLASLTITVYVPAAIPARSWVIAPLLQE